MAFFLLVAELDFARNGGIVDFCVDRPRYGYVLRGCNEFGLQVLGKFVKVIR